MVLDMEDSARQARAEVAQCMAEEKRLTKRVEQLAGEISTWEEHAMRAVKAGDDALAREALKRKAEKEADRIEAEKTLNDQRSYVDQLTAGLKALDARVKEVKMRQGTLREKARASKGKSPTSRPTRRPSTTSSACPARSTRWKPRRAWPKSFLATPPERRETDRKLRELTEDRSVDDALAELKKKLGG